MASVDSGRYRNVCLSSTPGEPEFKVFGNVVADAHQPAGAFQIEQPVPGPAGLEADLEVMELALDCLGEARVGEVVIDLADARVLRGVLAGVPLDGARLQEIVAALSEKDGSALAELTTSLPAAVRDGFRSRSSPSRRPLGSSCFERPRERARGQSP